MKAGTIAVMLIASDFPEANHSEKNFRAIASQHHAHVTLDIFMEIEAGNVG
jgi:hypothetical protein